MKTKTILIADDETHILNVLTLKLKNAGYEVIIARDGEEALECAKAQRPDLLITDLQMPRLTGLELCQKMRQDPKLADVPTIMLSARGFMLEPGDTAGSGIVQMLSKPFSPRELLSSVDQILAKAA